MSGYFIGAIFWHDLDMEEAQSHESDCGATCIGVRGYKGRNCKALYRAHSLEAQQHAFRYFSGLPAIKGVSVQPL